VAAVGTCAVLAAIQLSYWKDAKELLRHATAVDQDNVVARIQLGAALIDDHDYYGAVQCLEEAEKVGPPRAEVQASLGMALAGQGRMEEAVMHLQAALGLKRGAADARKDALNNLAWIRATCADPAYRSGAEAVRLAEEACKITDRRRPDMLDTLAAAYAEAGRYGDAVTTALEAEALATAQGLPGIARELLDRVRLYQAGKPYHERPPAGAPGISGPKQSLVIPNERSESRNLAVGAPSAPVSQQDPSASLGVTTKKDLPESREAPPASSARAAP
jgi:tetratricopeptide (TPR) repeat protein